MAGQLDIISTVLLYLIIIVSSIRVVVLLNSIIIYGTASHLPNLLYMKVEEEENNIESATHSSSIQPKLVILHASNK